MPGTVIALGTIPLEDLIVRGVVREYGWSLKCVQNISSLEKLREHFDIAAVLFQLGEWPLDPLQTIRAIRAAAPGAKPILVHRFTDPFSWPAMAAAGAYHAIRVPFAFHEVHQSLGFVWAARATPESVFPMIARQAVA